MANDTQTATQESDASTQQTTQRDSTQQTQDQTSQSSQQSQQTQQQTSSGNPFVNPDGTLKEGFKEHLPEHLQQDKSLDKFKDFQSLTQSYKNLEERLGKKGVTIPDENSSQEEWDQFKQALNIVSDPNSLELPEPENMPEGFEQDEKFTDQFKQAVAEAGVSEDAAKTLWQRFHDWAGERYQQMNQQTEEAKNRARDELRQEWGRSFDHNVEAARRAAEQLGVLEQLDQSGYGNDPLILRMLKGAFDMIGEDTLGTPGGPSPEDAQSQITQIRQDPNHAYNNPNAPGHQEAVKKMQRLYQTAYG